MVTVIVVGIFVAATITVPPLKRAVLTTLRKAGLMPVVTRVAQKMGLATTIVREGTILPPDRVSVRRNRVAELYEALEAHDFRRSAFLNSLFSQEAFQRAYRTLKAWEGLRDPETGLVPTYTHPKMAFWNAKDTAADLFPFLLIASQLLDRDNERLWLETLSMEREICGTRPCTVRFHPAKKADEDLPDEIFGASEYAKDGLLSVSERSGRGPWFVRLEEIAQSLIGAAPVETPSGRIFSKSTEVNGNMLQVFARLYSATRKPEYLQMAERIAEVYLFDILPNSHYLPPLEWNFSRRKPEGSFKQLRDHGSELIPGLAELYFVEKTLKRPQASRYREALKKFLDSLLVIGRTSDGLWHNTVDIKTHEPVNRGLVDTWGYILNAYQIFDIAEGTSRYGEEIRRTMRAAAALKSFSWEGRSHDGYADSIESMIYLLPWFDIRECHRWVDDEIEVMFHMQAPSGFISEGYLDGNFIRTALLYAFYKTHGVMIHPWREDVSLGAAYDRERGELYLSLTAESRWEGLLRFDLPRHRILWDLPAEYPRLNGWPEWFVAEPQKIYALLDLASGKKSFYRGKSLAEGIPVTVDERRSPLYLKVTSK